jgi:hypothetical protein
MTVNKNNSSSPQNLVIGWEEREKPVVTVEKK